MDALTIFVILVALVGAAFGWASGIIRQVGKLLGFILGMIACRVFGGAVSNWLTNGETSPNDALLFTLLAYAIIFLLVYVLMSFTGNTLRKTLSFLNLGVLDRVCGAVFKMVTWLVFLSMAINLYVAMFPDTGLASSPVYNRILAFGPFIMGSETARAITQSIGGAMGF